MKLTTPYFFLVLLAFVTTFESCQQKSGKNETMDLEARSEIIKAQEINDLLKKGENIAFKNSTILGNINFAENGEMNIEAPNVARSTINSSVIFKNCTFKGKLIAQQSDTSKTIFTTFYKNLTFIDCTFQDELIFKEAFFLGIVLFQDSQMEDKVDFTGTTFNFNKTYFSNNKFIKAVNFANSKFRGEINFMRSEFSEAFVFQNAKFLDSAQFGVIKCAKYTDFSGINATGNLFFNYAEFSGVFTFNNVNTLARCEFKGVKFNENTEFKKSRFNGNITFKEAHFTKINNFENSFFNSTKPDFSGIVKSDSATFNLQATQIITKQPLVKTNFETKK